MSTTSLEPKRLGFLHELVPQAATVGFLLNANFPLAKTQQTDAENAARDLGLKIAVLPASTIDDIERAFKSIDEQGIKALLVAASPFFDTRKEHILDMVAKRRIPAMCQFREYPVAGGLMSYGTDLPDVYRQVGIYTGVCSRANGRATLPILQPTKFELVINSKTAKARHNPLRGHEYCRRGDRMMGWMAPLRHHSAKMLAVRNHQRTGSHP